MGLTHRKRQDRVLVLAAMLLGSGAGCAESSDSAQQPPPETSGAAASATPTAPETTAAATPAPSATPRREEIPAGFPIDVDLRAMPGDGGEILGPSARTPGVGKVEACGAVLWPATNVTERLAVVGTGPEFSDVRELVVLPTTERAEGLLSSIRAGLADCPSEDNQLDPQNSPDYRWLEYAGVDTGYDSVSFAQTYTEGLGGTLFQVTRVGHSVLLVATSGEYPSDPPVASFRDLSKRTRAIAPAQCPFTEAGC